MSDPAGLIVTVDVPILELLPREGTLVGGLRPLGMTMNGVRDRLNTKYPDARLTSNELSTRLRVLHHYELVTTVAIMGASGRHGWQITETGQRWLDEHRDGKPVADAKEES